MAYMGKKFKKVDIMQKFIWFLVLIAACMPTAFAQNIKIISNPIEYSESILKGLQDRGAEDTGRELSEAMRNPEAKNPLSSALRIVEKKRPLVSGIAFEKNYNNLIRTIIIYNYIDSPSIPFVYFNFTYKKIEGGWALTGFHFASEASAIFPADMLKFIN